MFRSIAQFFFLGAGFATAFTAAACGEGVFHTGDGLRFQGYLAPRPATVLVFDSERTPAAERIAVYRGLVQAGHSLTVAHDSGELILALQERPYDIVVAHIDVIDSVTSALPAATPMPRLLPVVERSQRNAAEVRDHFAQVVVDGASVGQYLGKINRLMRN